MRTVVRETILRRRRSRLPWIYLVYHAHPSETGSVAGDERTSEHDDNARNGEQGAKDDAERLVTVAADGQQR